MHALTLPIAHRADIGGDMGCAFHHDDAKTIGRAHVAGEADRIGAHGTMTRIPRTGHDTKRSIVRVVHGRTAMPASDNARLASAIVA